MESGVVPEPEALSDVARSGKLLAIGLYPLSVRRDWAFSEKFPSEPFVVRGPNSENLFKLSKELLRSWNDGDVDVKKFVNELKLLNLVTISGVGFPGCESSKAVSFDLSESDFEYKPRSNLKLTSMKCTATSGSWFERSQIKWGGGESVSKVVSGSQLWLIAGNITAASLLYAKSTYASICDFLTKDSSRCDMDKNLGNDLYYHLAKPGDLIVLPSCSVHCVITEPSFCNGSPLWSLVAGYECIDVHDDTRGRKIISNFARGMQRGGVAHELSLYGFAYLVRLLKIRDYRDAEAKCRHENGLNMMDYYIERNVTSHVKHLFRFGYDLEASLKATKVQPISAKRKRSANLGIAVAQKPKSSILSEITPDEAERWPAEVIADLDETAPRRK